MLTTSAKVTGSLAAAYGDFEAFVVDAVAAGAGDVKEMFQDVSPVQSGALKQGAYIKTHEASGYGEALEGARETYNTFWANQLASGATPPPHWTLTLQDAAEAPDADVTEAHVSSAAGHLKWVEEGTRYMAERPNLQQSLEAERPNITNRIEDAVQNGAAKANRRVR